MVDIRGKLRSHTTGRTRLLHSTAHILTHVALAVMLAATAAGAYDENEPIDSNEVFDEWRPHGPVKTIQERSYKGYRRRGKLMRNELWTYEREHRFDRRGWLITYRYQHRTLSFTKETHFSYDSAGRPVEIIRDLTASSFGARYTYAWDEHGRLTDFRRLDPAGHETRRVVLAYDSLGRRARREEYEDSSFTCLSVDYVYDSTDVLIGRRDIDNTGDTTTVAVEVKLVDGIRMHIEEHIDERGRTVGKFLRGFDADGRLVDSWEKDIRSGEVSKRVWRFDSAGRRIEASRIEDNRVIDRNIFIYDSLGRLQQRLDYGATGELERRRHEFRYDRYGNWLRYIEEDGRYVTVQERTIEYFE
ncbi:MAG: hypothetical protein GF331_17995 [Chitinivibrionales bacterium]|nr:hypothetical protein [Chitinivibrionales bacterium]